MNRENFVNQVGSIMNEIDSNWERQRKEKLPVQLEFEEWIKQYFERDCNLEKSPNGDYAYYQTWNMYNAWIGSKEYYKK